MPLKVCVISGSIGAGKSSILNGLAGCIENMPKVHIFPENTAEWQYYLEHFYRQPEEYAFFFQKEVEQHFHRVTKALELVAERLGDDQDRTITAFVERSPLEALEIFIPLNRACFEPRLYQCIMTSMRAYAERPIWRNAKYLMVQCPPAVCMDRIKSRARDGENAITPAYLKALDERYAQFAAARNAVILDNGQDDADLLACIRRLKAEIVV